MASWTGGLCVPLLWRCVALVVARAPDRQTHVIRDPDAPPFNSAGLLARVHDLIHLKSSWIHIDQLRPFALALFARRCMSFGRVPFRSVHIPFRPRFRSFAARFVSNMSGEKRKASSPSQDQATLGDLTSRKAQHTDSTDTPGASTSKDASPSKSKLSASATEFKPSAPVAPSSAPKAATNSLFGPQLPSAWAVAGAHQSLLLGQFGDPTSSALQLLDQREQKDEPLVTFALLDLDWTVIKPKPNGTKDKVCQATHLSF